jgi:hypothetical protein
MPLQRESSLVSLPGTGELSIRELEEVASRLSYMQS